jgi:hypothetical protein
MTGLDLVTETGGTGGARLPRDSRVGFESQ